VNKSPVVVQHSFGALGSGGPVGALARVLASDLNHRFIFETVSQEAPAGGINLRLIQRMRREIRAARPDIVHVRGLGNEGFHGVVAAKLAGVSRVLVSIHGSQRDLVFPNRLSLRRAFVGWVLEPLTLLLSSAVFVVCEEGLRRPILRRRKNKLLGVVPNGVELRTRDDDARGRLRNELRIGPDEVVVVIVARVVRDKGHFDLIEALATVERSLHNPTHVLIVGEGDDLAAVIDAGRALTNTVLHAVGRRSDVPNLLDASDIFVLPSYHEGMSNALLEAMAAGLPVIATSVGGSTEVVQHGGGMLVSPGHPQELADALSSLLVSPTVRERLGEDARRTVIDHYTIKHMTDRLGSFYDQMLAMR